jgi:hypothetical protein
VGTGPRTRLALGDLLAECASGLRLLAGEDGAAAPPRKPRTLAHFPSI